MNAVATTAPRPQIMAGGSVAALVPQSLDEAFRVAQAIAASGMAPKGFERAEQVMVAIMAGAELGLAPFQSLQSFAIVNNRPTLWGDGLMAVARAQGIQARETLEGEGDQMVAFCSVTRPDTGEVIQRQFSVADAKKASLWNKPGPWQAYPRRMLQMRARAWALRDGCADMLRGFQVREEVEDYQPETVRQVPREAPNLAARLAGPKADDQPTEGFTQHHPLGDDDIPNFDQTTGEIIDAASDDSFPGDPPHTAEETTARSAEPKGDEETGLAVDVIAWADKLIADLPFFTPEQVAHLEQDRKELATFAILKVTDMSKAKALETAIAAAKEG